MPAYNFQKRFAQLVLSGQKKQTVRAKRKDGRAPKVGQPFVGYTGMRTKTCERLITSTIIKVQDIRITAGIYVDGSSLMADQALLLAKADGFHTVHDFLEWFRTQHGAIFEGHIITWR